MRYFYEVAGLRVMCDLPFELKIQKETEKFISVADQTADMFFEFRAVNGITTPENYHSEVNRLFSGGKTFFAPHSDEAPYACVSRTANGLLCEYVRGMESYINLSHNICDLMQIETMLKDMGGLLLHASFISWMGKGILFSAPSGTGKSTQASLWEEYENAEIVNGDRCGLLKENGAWFAYGLPYAGSSNIYKNKRESLGAIIVLRQAKENKIRRLSPAESVKYLYPEASIHRWDADFVNAALDVMAKLVTEVPVYLLECLPDAGAVETAKSEILKQWE